MIKLTVALLVVGVCFAAPPPAERPPPPKEVVPIVSQQSDAQPDGQYNFAFEGGDGTQQQQTGEVKVVEDKPVISVSGKYSYVDAEGATHSVSYTADETGYHPEGDILPVGPPIPEAIARSLQYIQEHPYVEENTA
ncbi:cuticle protein [Holotrichia oblita]|uniref:Cuticle protein n=1 Tax=Holotrichia oblita TaxID=644536 RepID=A0ACB9SRS5_HOLOL|nr:cuticle protein [Holotrichia oblita]